MLREKNIPVAPLPHPELKQHRKRSVILWSMRDWDEARYKEFFLKVYRVTGNLKTSISRLGLPAWKFYGWKKRDPQFVVDFNIITVMWDELLRQQATNLNLKAIRVIELLLDQGIEDPKKLNSTVMDVAVKLLKSGGVLSDRSTVEHVGEGGGPIQYTNTTEIKRSTPPEAIEAESVKVLEPEEE